VKKHKLHYPYFLRTDISAPQTLYPLWMELIRLFHLPLIAGKDDLLVMAENPVQLNEVYQFIAGKLQTDFDLPLRNTKSGRFARDTLDFAGWHFAGGYATISREKVEAFKDRLSKEAGRGRGKQCTVAAFIKRMNRRIDRFGHYYKHGDTAKQFAELDVHIRRLVRIRLVGKERCGTLPNSALEGLGLHSLAGIYRRWQEKEGRVASPAVQQQVAELLQTAGGRSRTAAVPPSTDNAELRRMLRVCEKIQTQIGLLLVMQRKQAHLLKQLLT
jgi:hypothetical protein